MSMLKLANEMKRSAVSKVVPVVLIVAVIVVGVTALMFSSTLNRGPLLEPGPEVPMGPEPEVPMEPEPEVPAEPEPEVPMEGEPVPVEPEPEVPMEPEPEVEPEPVMNLVRLTLTGRGIRWVMNGEQNPMIEVPLGSVVEIEIFNEDNVPHQFAIDEFNIRIDRINSGESATVSFIADREGTFRYRCVIHPVIMDGAIVVTP